MRMSEKSKMMYCSNFDQKFRKRNFFALLELWWKSSKTWKFWELEKLKNFKNLKTWKNLKNVKKLKKELENLKIFKDFTNLNLKTWKTWTLEVFEKTWKNCKNLKFLKNLKFYRGLLQHYTPTVPVISYARRTVAPPFPSIPAINSSFSYTFKPVPRRRAPGGPGL